MAKKISIAAVGDIVEGDPISAQAEGVELVIVKINQSITVFEGRCPHQGTMLAEGTLENGALVCRAHGWRFDSASGVKDGNPSVCLKSFSVEINDGQILVDQDELLAWKGDHLAQGVSSGGVSALRSLAQLPGPNRLPLLGNSHQIKLKKFHQILEAWSQSYGSIFKINIGRKPIVVINDPDLAHIILRERPENFRRLEVIKNTLSEMGVHGVFTAEGDDWRRQRHLVMQALDTKHLHQFFPTLVKVTERLKRRWDQAVEAKDPVEVKQDLKRFTVDVTTNLAFGYDMNTLEQEGDAIQQHMEKIFPMIDRRNYAVFPYWRYFKLPADRSLDVSLDVIRAMLDEFIDHSRDQLDQHPDRVEQPANLLEGMLVARDEENAQFKNDEIFGNAVTILLAGEDTTANTIAWIMYFMSKYPDVQRKMQAEVDTVLGSSTMLQQFTDTRKLAYIEAVAHETMRLKPVAPLLGLQTNTELELGGVQFPKDTSIMLLTRPGALREQDFAQGEEFQPDRWLARHAADSLHHHKSYIPFGSGPRLCPGRSLALLEIKTAMAMVCRNFDIVNADRAGDVQEVFAFTMLPDNLFLSFRNRTTLPVRQD